MRISGLFCPRSAPARVEFSTTSNFILSPSNVMKQIKTTVSPMLSPFGSQNPTPIWSPKQDSFSILLYHKDLEKREEIIEKMFPFGNSHPIVTRGSRVARAPSHHAPSRFSH